MKKNIGKYLRSRIFGQDAAIEAIVQCLEPALYGFSDESSPLGVIMLAGPSGTGKTEMAKALQEALDKKTQLGRIDCNQLMEQHQTMTLLGAPHSYVGYEDEALLSLVQPGEKEDIKVILLDEVEKAHPAVMNVFLRIFDEGTIVDSAGEFLDFRSCVFVMTSNIDLSGGPKKVGFASNNAQPGAIEAGDHTHNVLRRYFRPEFINRIDAIVEFENLDRSALLRIAKRELNATKKKLAQKGMDLSYTKEVPHALVSLSSHRRFAQARAIKMANKAAVENLIAQTIRRYNLCEGCSIKLRAEGDDIGIEFNSSNRVSDTQRIATRRADHVSKQSRRNASDGKTGDKKDKK